MAVTQPSLSLILCSRNDEYQGNSLWRLSAALNYAAAHAEDLGVLGSLELIVADWGSASPLRSSVHLSPAAASRTRFLWIKPELAKRVQQDSPFPEVLALNAAARRASGDYIGRIDQDTLIGERFFRWFFFEHPEGDAPEGTHSILMSNRRNVPFRFAVRCPDIGAVFRYVDGRQTSFKIGNPQPDDLYYRSPIGVLLMHRTMWQDCRGYDESMIYFNYMEYDLILRLMMKHPFVHLGRILDHAFFHLDHEHPFSAWGVSGRRRKMNPVRDAVDNPPPEFAPNTTEWGMPGEASLVLEVGEPSEAWRTADGSGAGASPGGYAYLVARTTAARVADALVLGAIDAIMAVPRFIVRRLPASMEARVVEARNAIKRQPLKRWPRILLSHMRTDSLSGGLSPSNDDPSSSV